MPNQISTNFSRWTDRKEVRLKDKYLKAKIRYTGDKIVVISGISTVYTISYS